MFFAPVFPKEYFVSSGFYWDFRFFVFHLFAEKQQLPFWILWGVLPLVGTQPKFRVLPVNKLVCRLAVCVAG